MMRVPGRKIVRRALRPLRRRLFPGAVVLGYHQVADDQWDPLQLRVRRANFAAQLEVLRDLREIISLRELVERRAAGESLDRYAVLTFDDGSRDFADTVVPMAAARNLPVTVFVASGCTDGQFWWEELTSLLAPRNPGSPTLQITINGDRPLEFSGLDQPEMRIEAANAIAERLAALDRNASTAVIEQLRRWAGPAADQRPQGQPMNSATLAALATNPLVEIGAHTVTHCFLEGLSHQGQREEIGQSKADLEKLCGRRVDVFSYPNGSYSANSPRIVRELGFACACTSREGMFTARGNPFMIPRLWVPDIPGPEFRDWLGNWVTEARA